MGRFHAALKLAMCWFISHMSEKWPHNLHQKTDKSLTHDTEIQSDVRCKVCYKVSLCENCPRQS